MQELLGKNVTLVINWNGGEDIAIKGKAAKPIDPGRVYYPLSYLAELYRNKIEYTDISDKAINPETGGVEAATNAMATTVAPQVTEKAESTVADSIDSKITQTTAEKPVEQENDLRTDIAAIAQTEKNADSNNVLWVSIALIVVVLGGFIIAKRKFLQKLN